MTSFKNRSGVVVPQTGDYTAEMVGAAPSGFGLGGICHQITGQDILDVMSSLKSGWYAGTNVSNAPTTGNTGIDWYAFEVMAVTTSNDNVYSVAVATNAYNGRRYIGYIYNDNWSGWTELATTNSPQMYPLPFVDGVSEYRLCRYFKTQNNIVHIFGELKFTNGISADQENAFVLPAGYRPISHILSPATYWWSDDTRCSGALMVGPDGYVTARISPYDIKTGLTTNMFIHTTFLAQG